MLQTYRIATLSQRCLHVIDYIQAACTIACLFRVWTVCLILWIILADHCLISHLGPTASNHNIVLFYTSDDTRFILYIERESHEYTPVIISCADVTFPVNLVQFSFKIFRIYRICSNDFQLLLYLRGILLLKCIFNIKIYIDTSIV